MKRIAGISASGLVCCLAFSFTASSQQPPSQQHLFIHVTLSSRFTAPVSGRLLVFVQRGTGAAEVDASPMNPTSTYVAAKEVRNWKPDTAVDVDADDLVFPEALSKAAAGDYQAQAVLDVSHTYNYLGRQPGDLLSAVVALPAWNPSSGSGISLALADTLTAPPNAINLPAEEQAGFKESLHSADLPSRLLTAFWGRPIHIAAWVLTPPGYDPSSQRRYPVVYFTHGFGANLNRVRDRYATEIYRRMKQKKMPEMIWVMLDESSPTGTHEFADSVNNGPWGTALTTEFIPWIETQYRMDGKVTGRFLQGHSSGGWATLWLQVNYPKIFGGTWSTSPDPSDFHSFSSIDFYAPHVNFYRRADGSPVPVVRNHGQVLATMEQLAKLEEVTGDYGGQLRSFEWVFSPRGKDGTPLPLFDRKTGEVDPDVAQYWCEHFDIAHLVEKNWSNLAPNVKGKIHLIVGTEDTFYLDGAAHRFAEVLTRLGADSHFTFLPGKTHFDLYQVGDDRFALFDKIAAEMYETARPSR